MSKSSCEKDLPEQDPDGSYIARWVPELAKLPKKYLHMPWKAPGGTLQAAGVSFGSSEGQYPHRITTEVMQVIFLCLQDRLCSCHAAYILHIADVVYQTIYNV